MVDPLTLGLYGGSVLAQGLGSLMGGNAQERAVLAQARAEKEAQERAIQEQRQAFSDVQGMYSPYAQYGQQALGGLSALMGDVQSGAYATPQEQFQFNQTTQDFLDPSMKYQQQRAMEGIEASRAGGGLHSGATLKELQDRGQQMAQMDWGNAFNRQMTARGQAYQQFRDKMNFSRMENADRFNRLSGLLSQQLGVGQNATGAMAGARTGLGQQMAQGQMNLGQLQGMQQAAPHMNTANQWQTFGQLAPTALGLAGSAFQPTYQPQQPTYQPLQQAQNQLGMMDNAMTNMGIKQGNL